MKTLIGTIFILMLGLNGASGAIVVDLANSPAKDDASTVFTFSDLSAATPVFDGGLYDRSAALAENSISRASGSVMVTWTATTATDATAWDFDTGSAYEIADYVSGWGLSTLNGADSGNLDVGDTFLLTFDCSNLTLDPGSALAFSIRTKDTGDEFTVYQRTAASGGSSVWVESTVANQFSPSIQINGIYEFAIVQTDGANRLNGFSIDVIDGPPVVGGPPEQATWDNAPTAYGTTASMSAQVGANPNVEYFFRGMEVVEGGATPHVVTSGWQNGTDYTVNNLNADSTYSFWVVMRNADDFVLGPWSELQLINTFTPSDRPNVVFIYADDLGYSDVSYNRDVRGDPDNPYFAHTPNIDTIFERGIFLSHSVTHQVCSPSRAGLLTGRHYTEVGSGLLVGGYLDDSVPNMARDFQDNGYITGAFGKWHNGKSPDSNIPGLSVNEYGFNAWEGFYGGGQDYFIQVDDDNNWWTDEYRHTEDLPGYSTDLTRDSALEFIDNNAAGSFFLYLPFQSVHTPYHVLNTDLKAMCDVFDDEYPHLAWSIVGEAVSPTTGRKIKDVLEMRCDRNDEFFRNDIEDEVEGFKDLVYHAMVYAIDRAVGDILNKLDAKGIANNTIVVFSADNGAVRSGNNSIYRGQKLTSWEGGTRVPSAIYYPGTLDSTTLPEGNEYPHMVQYVDWYPTLMATAGLTVNPAAELDGVSFYESLLSGTRVRAFWDPDTLYYGLDDSWAIIKNDRFKLHYNKVPGAGEMVELYDLWNDPSESVTVNDSFAAPLSTMKSYLEAWFESGKVTTGYMPLPADLDRNPPSYPSGDVLEITANQTGDLSDPNEHGVYARFGIPDWTAERDQHVFPGDRLEYDIYVAADSEQTSGFFVTPSFFKPVKGESPRFDLTHGIGLDDGLIVNQVLQRETWTHCAIGIGDVAPGRSLDMTIGLLNSNAGNYHFYIDNVVIRKSDGTLRTVIWEDDNDSRTGSVWMYFKGRYFPSFDGLPIDSDLKLNSFNVDVAQSVDLIDLDPDDLLNFVMTSSYLEKLVFWSGYSALMK